jgi:hypothetical protein
MQFLEVDERGYRLFLGALEARQGGYTAALAVRPLNAPAGAQTPFRDDSLACGHRFSTADDALSFALRHGRAWVRARHRSAAVAGDVPPDPASVEA